MSRYLFLLSIFIITNTFAKDSVFTTSISFVGMSMDYREYDRSKNLLDTETSNYVEVGGVELSLGYIIEEDSSYRSKIDYNFMILTGNTVYTGSYRDSDLGFGSLVASTLNTVTDKDISFTQSRVLNNNIEISYGIGLGYRYWERVLSAYQIEIYTWYSIRPMIGVTTKAQENLTLGAFIEYQYGFDTKMSASDVDYTFTLGGADILEFRFPIKYTYKEDLNLFFEAVFQKQTIKESNRLYTPSRDAYYYEPDSTAYNSYLKMGIEYSF